MQWRQTRSSACPASWASCSACSSQPRARPARCGWRCLAVWEPMGATVAAAPSGDTKRAPWAAARLVPEQVVDLVSTFVQASNLLRALRQSREAGALGLLEVHHIDGHTACSIAVGSTSASSRDHMPVLQFKCAAAAMVQHVNASHRKCQTPSAGHVCRATCSAAAGRRTRSWTCRRRRRCGAASSRCSASCCSSCTGRRRPRVLCRSPSHGPLDLQWACSEHLWHVTTTSRGPSWSSTC